MLKYLLIFAIYCQVSELCKTPNKEPGICVPLDSCISLRSILNQPVVPQDEFDFVILSQCQKPGFVCCPNSGVSSTTTTTEEVKEVVEEVTETPNIIQSSNLPVPGAGVCGIHLSDKIFGGTKIGIDEHPWMALLEYNDNGQNIFACGGVLISSRYVLTAAHCIRTTPFLKSVRLGEWNLKTEEDCDESGDCSDPVQDIPIEQTISHIKYDSSDRNSLYDIALIRLIRPVQFTYFIKPICLPFDPELQKDTIDVGKEFTVAGWGRTEKGTWSDIKLKLDVKGVDLQKCSQVYGNPLTPQLQRKLIPEQICAGGELNKDSCGGDSGGPLMRTWRDSKGKNYVFVAGIVSYGPTNCGQKGWPGVYTRVTSYLDWIQKNIRP
ncbi:serine protease easter-like [Culicoides brevitarsis]|uniref:serine protease easter-like n=1 Tax=Culicoides brevitarsis TaxID=469753 RepID=UPI00307C725F